VVAHPTAAKQVIGVVPQTSTLDRSLTVWENCISTAAFFGMAAATAKAEATRLLEQFRLVDRAREPIAALSGGMAQRLMVGAGDHASTATLFLDEPTAGLDPQSRIALWEILGELHSDGQTILLTTHYMEEPTSSATGSRSSTAVGCLPSDLRGAETVDWSRHHRHGLRAR